jgi:hypothetical protein
MNRQTRILLPWLEDLEAITNLLGRIPAQGEDLTAQQSVLNVSRANLQARPAYSLSTPVIDNLPEEVKHLSVAFRTRPEVVAALQGLDWTLGMVDLKQVLSFQKMVVEEQALERVKSVQVDDLQHLFSLCLPENGSEMVLSGALDHDQRGVTLSSLNPNLRVGGQLAFDMEVPVVAGTARRKEKVVGFTINFGVNFVQIAEYEGRWFVRDGYHRTYGLLRRGIHNIPCVFIRARSLQELGAAQPGFFPYQVLFGERPPFLTDFLDDTTSVSVTQRATRKVVRISAEEFVVEV